MPYSGSDPGKDIKVESLPLNSVLLSNGTMSEPVEGISLKYKHGSVCPTSQTGDEYTFTINVYCAKDVEYDYIPIAHGDPCHPYVNFVSEYGCSTLDVSELWGYIGKYEDYFGVFAIVSGFILCFFGHFLVKPSVCFAGFLSTIALSCFIFYAVYLNTTSDLADFWYFLGGGALAGIFVGLLLAWAIKIGASILAGWGGLCLALILNETILYRFGAEWLFWTSIVIIMVACAVAAFFIFDVAVVMASVTLGAYAMVRGVSAYAGHYYNEVTMAEMLKDGLLDEIDPYYWIYVGGFVVAMLLGSLVQCKRLNRIKAKKEAQQHPYMKAKSGQK